MSENKKGLLITLAIINIILIIVWLSIFIFAQKESRFLEEQYDSLATENEKEGYVRDVSRDLRETENLRTELGNFFVRAGEEASFLERIESLAKRAEVGVKVFTFEKDEKIIRLSLESNGTFSRNYYFLSLIESLPYNLTVSKVVYIKEGQEDKVTWRMRLDLTLHSYLVI